MGMTRKSALYALAVVVLTGSMAVAALADDHGMNEYGPADTSVLSEPEKDVVQSDAGEIREPMETGAVPDRSGSSSDLYCCSDSGDPTFQLGGP
ncbi:MAG: hypothetical protein HW377_2446 [Actinobacteria bacterium]|nr:hypothetical protein [Actinomycetota bacterium]